MVTVILMLMIMMVTGMMMPMMMMTVMIRMALVMGWEEGGGSGRLGGKVARATLLIQSEDPRQQGVWEKPQALKRKHTHTHTGKLPTKIRRQIGEERARTIQHTDEKIQPIGASRRRLAARQAPAREAHDLRRARAGQRGARPGLCRRGGAGHPRRLSVGFALLFADCLLICSSAFDFEVAPAGLPGALSSPRPGFPAELLDQEISYEIDLPRNRFFGRALVGFWLDVCRYAAFPSKSHQPFMA